MKERLPCTTCKVRPKAYAKNRCTWCWLKAQPIELQIAHARRRRRDAPGPYAARRAATDGPPGHRWCAGCQSWIPDDYVRGSRCIACDSESKHASHIKQTYSITRAQYELLLTYQQGRCYICQRVPRSRRLAVDHDHVTGEVRGLLCSDDERGCNHAVLGNIRDLAMARRIVAYLEQSPVERIRAGEGPVTIEPTKPTVDHGPPPF